MHASMRAGFGYTETGIEKVFLKTLADLGVESTGFNAVDGSGLSKSNKLSARMMGQLLLKTYTNVKYSSIYGGLPIGGVSGTMQDRFIKSAPSAISRSRPSSQSFS